MAPKKREKIRGQGAVEGKGGRGAGGGRGPPQGCQGTCMSKKESAEADLLGGTLA